MRCSQEEVEEVFTGEDQEEVFTGPAPQIWSRKSLRICYNRLSIRFVATDSASVAVDDKGGWVWLFLISVNRNKCPVAVSHMASGLLSFCIYAHILCRHGPLCSC